VISLEISLWEDSWDGSWEETSLVSGEKYASGMGNVRVCVCECFRKKRECIYNILRV